MQHHTTSTRLATAVAAVLAVTALGAGTLATAPAALAATAGPVAEAPAEASELPGYAEAAEMGGVAPSGFLTYSFEDDGSRQLRWTPFDGGAPTPLGEPEGWSIGGGDVVVLGNAGWTAEFTAVTLRNMADPSSPAVEIDLGPLNGRYVSVLSPTSVLAQLTKADGTTELHVVTREGAGTASRKVTGLPADAADFLASGVQGGKVLVGYATGPQDARTGGRAFVDVAAGTASETYASDESGYDFSTLQFSDSHVAWVDYNSADGLYVTSVDRATKTRQKTVLGARDSEAYAGLLGEWLVHGKPWTTAQAVNLKTGETRVVADRATSAAPAGDGTLVMRGERAADGKGLFRIAAAQDGTPTVTKVASEVAGEPVAILGSQVPATVDLDASGGRVALGWTLSRADAYLKVTLTHNATGKWYQQYVHSPTGDEKFSFTWDGVLEGVDAPNGAYTVLAEAEPNDGAGGGDQVTRQLTLTRTANPHDFTDNGSTDVLARDAAGVLWRNDLRDRPVNDRIENAQRTRIGSGWNTYKQIEAVGNIAGAAHGDLVGVDGSGVLWHYLGKGDGTFTARRQVGGGWQAYDKITGGSDLNGDGRSDLLATDTSGVLWFYKGTGDSARPFATRVRVGGGWGVYNQLTAVGNIAGAAAGDLVARDKDGVLWLYLGKGDGTFAGRIQVGGGWGAFSQLVGAGDVDADGRPDLIAYGAGGTYVYKSNGSATRPFTRLNTDLYAGEGTKFTSVS
ncbi:MULTISPECIES: VCBS repeat-containing protein [unclassified Streptomyces]|uniref:FG-GAP repeat domain-containing protein n=1 Tax=unclassified Streptomyces TaxID=2593676 RepID=UPI0019CF5092|nr:MULTISPECIES: VCBS repeat-containing protein [unclassified Streptomyces]